MHRRRGEEVVGAHPEDADEVALHVRERGREGADADTHYGNADADRRHAAKEEKIAQQHKDDRRPPKAEEQRHIHVADREEAADNVGEVGDDEAQGAEQQDRRGTSGV